MNPVALLCFNYQMKIKTIILASILLSTTALKAENYMIVMGGGGEPEGNKTIFDGSMKTLGNNLKGTDWQYQVSFNGGHAETEQILSSQYPTPASPTTNFTPENYDQMLSEYKARILMGDIKPGDQIMLIMNTHGAAKNPTSSTKTHLVAAKGGAATDLNNLSGTKLVSMDKLEELVKLTNEKGIKMGIVDLSCHSGNTMALKKDAPNTCIISATGPNHYGYAGDSTFAGQFMKNLKKGTTLEMAFLNARADTKDPSFPMISTDEGAAISAEVYAKITPYLYYYDPSADKLSDYLLNNSSDCVICTRDQQFTALINQINQLESAARGTKKGYNAQELKRLITEYKRQQDDLIKAAQATGYNMLSKKENFSAPVVINGKTSKTWTLSFTWKDMMNLDPDNTLANLTKYRAKSRTPQEKAEDQAVLQVWTEVKRKQQEIFSQYPELKTAQEESKRIVKAIGQNRDTAEKIALQEKKFYDELYRQKQSLNVNDPCRKIVF